MTSTCDPSLQSARPVPIAVIGMACRFPDASNAGAFFENLSRGHDAVREIPGERWDSARYYSPRFDAAGRAHSKWCAMLSDVARFDAACFGISPREAAHMDPQQRLLLEETWHCLEDAGIAPKELDARGVGVFVGAMAIDYHQNATADEQRVTGYTGSGNYACMLANRISHHFELGGPSQTIDAACASSLVAIHQARRALVAGECTQAIVGAVSLDLNPWKYIAFSKARMLSPSGRCKTFDASADGYVPGEGVAVLLLERLDRALASGHRIHGLLLGSAVNHNGGGASLTAPNVDAQVEVVSAAHASAHVSARSLQVIEAHGTGTSLGDPIEVEALRRVFSAAGAFPGSCSLGSVKSNVGHLEAAAGMAGVFKVLSMMQRRSIVPTLHVERPNPLLALEGSPFVLATEARPWQPSSGQPRRAGVSSFGFGGVNAHVVLEEAPTEPDRAPVPSAEEQVFPFVLSARSEQDLARLIGLYRAWAESPAFSDSSLADVSRTLVCGRAALAVRVGVAARSKRELQQALLGLDATSARRSEARAGFGLHLEGNFAPPSGELGAFLARYGEGGALDSAAPAALLGHVRLAGAVRAIAGEPARLSGTGQGALAALVLAGVIPEDGASEMLSGCVDLPRLATRLRSPRSVVFDPIEACWLHPETVDLDDLVLRAEDELSGTLVASLDESYRALSSHQFTFKKLIEEWQASLALREKSLAELLRVSSEGRASRGERLLVCWILAACLVRLSQKWSLSSLVELPPAFAELVELTRAGVFEREDCVAVALGGAAERARALENASRRCHEQGCHAERRDEPSPALASRGERWLAELAALSREAGRGAPEFSSGTLLRLAAERGALGSSDVIWRTSAELAAGFTQAMVQLWERGYGVRLEALLGGQGLRCALPLYPFGGEAHWLERRPSSEPEPRADVASSPTPAGSYDAERDPLIRDHVIAGRVIAPGALLLGLLLAHRNERGAPVGALSRLVLTAPAFVEPRCTLKVRARPGTGRLELECDQRGVAVANEAEPRARLEDVPPEPSVLGDPIDCSWLYEDLQKLGYGYGPSLRVLSELRTGPSAAWALVDAGAQGGAGLETFTRVIDGAFQAAIAVVRVALARSGTPSPEGVLYVPHTIEAAQIEGELPRRCFVHAELAPPSRSSDVVAEIRIFSMDAVPLARLAGVRLSKLSAEKLLPKSRVRAELASVPEPFCYAPAWSPVPPPDSETLPNHVILVGGPDRLVAELRAALGARGSAVTEVAVPSEGSALKPALQNAIDTAVSGLDSAAAPLGICWLEPCALGRAPETGAALAHQIVRGSFGLVELVQAVLQSRARSRARVVVATEGSASVGAQGSSRGYAHGGLFGLARSAMLEAPRLDLRSVDWEGEGGASALVAVLASSERGRAWAARGGQFSSPVVHPVPLSVKGWEARSDGAYVVVGGAGGVGLSVLRWLAESGVRKLAVIGRSALGESRRSELEALEQGGVQIAYAQADVADQAALAAALSGVRALYGSIRGLVHLGGVLEDRLLVNKDRASFERVIAPKAIGVFNLDELTRDDPLDHFVIFSSVVSLFGNVGQCDYACANGVLDAFAEQRRRRWPSQLTVSINWTMLAGAGMAAKPEAQRQLAKVGLNPLSEERARRAFLGALAGGFSRLLVLSDPPPPDSVAVAQIPQQTDPAAVTLQIEADRMIEIRNRSPENPAPAAAEAERLLASRIRQAIAEVLSVGPDSLDDHEDFGEYGVNSLAIMEIVSKLDVHYGDAVHHSAMLEYPSIARLTAHLASGLFPAGQAPRPEPAAAPPDAPPGAAARVAEVETRRVEQRGEAPIAILSMACRLPGAPTTEAFWANLRGGRVLTRDTPELRRDADRPTGMRPSFPQRGCFIDDIELFDAAHFGLSVEEAAGMDPQQRIFLELGQELFDGAGYTRAEVAGRAVGIFVGGHDNDYGRWIPGRPRYAGKSGVVNMISNMIVGRLANAFDLRGPAQTIFTACSSSLVATHEACAKLRAGECELAIAGGIELQLDEAWFEGFSAAKVLSEDAVCRVFDRDANGFVLGEGAGAVLLKPLDRAIADGDPIVGVILGSASNNDGSTMGLTTPSLDAQRRLIELALGRAGVSADSIGYYEAHGTGTQLGDPIEFKAATEVFRRQTQVRGYCGIGSVKASIGHLLSAAGIASLLKATLMLQHGELVPTVNCQNPNPRFGLESSPFFVVREPCPFRAPSPRRACVSAFGFGGTNGHVVLEAAPADHRPTRPPLPRHEFRRVRCWLDRNDRAEQGGLSPSLTRLLEDLSKGLISPTEAKRVVRVAPRAT